MKYASADKKTGLLIHTMGNYYFRIYDEAGFKDYKVVHSDLVVTIDDKDAYLYQKNGELFLDHSPQTLGIS